MDHQQTHEPHKSIYGITILFLRGEGKKKEASIVRPIKKQRKNPFSSISILGIILLGCIMVANIFIGMCQQDESFCVLVPPWPYLSLYCYSTTISTRWCFAAIRFTRREGREYLYVAVVTQRFPLLRPQQYHSGKMRLVRRLT